MTILALLLPMAIAVGPWIPTTGAARASSEPAAARERSVALRIDPSPLLEREDKGVVEHTVFFVRNGGVKALGAAGAEVVDEARAAAILVTLGWSDYEESIYEVRIATQRPGEKAQPLETFTCACINSGLAAAVSERMPAALEHLDETRGEEPVATAQEPPVESNEVENEPGPPDAPPKRAPKKAAAIGGTGIAGIVVAGSGVAMAGFGISRLAIGETRTRHPTEEQLDVVRDVRPAGRAWLGVGVGAIVAGVAMVVIDATLLRKQRVRAVAASPAFGPGQVGVELRGRF